MSEQEIRLTIAKYCKWEQAPFDEKYFYVPLQKSERIYTALDPLHDLNACKVASASLDYWSRDKYITMIFDYAQDCASKLPPSNHAIKEPWGQFAVDLCAEKRAEFLAIVIKGIK